MGEGGVLSPIVLPGYTKKIAPLLHFLSASTPSLPLPQNEGVALTTPTHCYFSAPTQRYAHYFVLRFPFEGNRRAFLCTPAPSALPRSLSFCLEFPSQRKQARKKRAHLRRGIWLLLAVHERERCFGGRGGRG